MTNYVRNLLENKFYCISLYGFNYPPIILNYLTFEFERFGATLHCFKIYLKLDIKKMN